MLCRRNYIAHYGIVIIIIIIIKMEHNKTHDRISETCMTRRRCVQLRQLASDDCDYVHTSFLMKSSITSWLLLPLLLFWLNVGVDCLDAKRHDSVRQTETPVALIQRSSSTSEAASLLRQHHDMKFIIENLEKHGVSFDQILIDLHHSEGKRILTSKDQANADQAHGNICHAWGKPSMQI